MVLIFRLNFKWLIISICLLLFSYYLNIDNNLMNNILEITNKLNFKNIYKSTFDNPFMNYIANNGNKNASTFPNLLPNNITINSDIPTNLNKFVNNNENFENTINYDLCITSNNNKSCTPNNKIENNENLPNKFKINNNQKKQIKKNYRAHLKFDSIDLWGELINDRNFFTVPNIDIVNDQTGFAKWCYTNNGKSGECKTDGSNCVKDTETVYHKDRYSN
jgi:hypothetical protein